ncbi:hypothetical protein N9K05_03325 [Woeseiaceae bacterium]|nr:hypothetical protein [Woeseiaceae bacterium]
MLSLSTFVIDINADTELESFWQTSTAGNQKRLSIRNKYSISDEEYYEARFVVYDKDSKKIYTTTIMVEQMEWGDVYFPKDFFNKDGSKLNTINEGIGNGDYIWNGVVENKIVVYGSFSFSGSVFDEKIELSLNKDDK